MKSRIFITTISILLLSSICKIYACGAPYYGTPAEYYTFRIYDNADLFYDDYGRSEQKSQEVLNCELWQKLTSQNIPLEDIYTTVYKFSYKDIQQVLNLIEQPNDKDTLMQNQFVKWLVHHKDKEIVNYLVLLRLYVKKNGYLHDPWYYSTEDDELSTIFAKIATQAKSYNGNRLKNRYAFLVIRALFATSQYEECINYWNDKQKSFSDDLIKEMMIPYIAGAYFRIGFVERALQIYAECGDVNSLLYCTGKQGKKIDEIEKMELVYKYCPNAPTFVEIMQNLIHRLEAYSKYKYDTTKWNKCLRLYDFALKVAEEKKVSNIALWYYTAAYIADLKGETQVAEQLLSKAEKAKGTPFIKESIKILRIYFDAKLMPYDSIYERRLFSQLQWLDNKIKNNIDERVKKHTAELDFIDNCSYYYWNDMLRKIILSEIAPRYIAQGNYVRAIQLVNMADNRLMNLVNQFTYYYDYSLGKWISDKKVTLAEYRKIGWNFDYSNNLFELIDTVGVNNLIAYTKRLKQSRSAFDSFLNKRGYTDLNYFNEIIGTQCLREMRYADAVKYFSQVPSSFQYTLNTYKNIFNEFRYWQYNCMRRDPFAFDCFNSRISNQSDYKYNFAREMYSLEQSIKQTKDPNRKAQLQIRYAIGIRNSINDCWALTQYYFSPSGYGNKWKESKSWKRANAKSEKLIKEALAMFTDDESAAQSYRFLGYNKKVLSKYPNTQMAEYIRRHCDNLRDYKGEE